MREFRIKVNNEKTYVVKANDYNQAVKTLHSKLRDFDDTKKNINVVREFITNNGGKFSKSKDADAILDFIYKKTGVKNADYGDVLYIVRNYTNVKVDDNTINDKPIKKWVLQSTINPMLYLDEDKVAVPGAYRGKQFITKSDAEKWYYSIMSEPLGSKNATFKVVETVVANDSSINDLVGKYNGEDAIKTNGFVKIKEDGDWTSYKYNGSDFDDAVFKIHQYNPSLIAVVSNGNKTITVRNKYLNDADDTTQGEIEVLKFFGFDYKDGRWVKESDSNDIIVQPDYHYVSVIGPDDTEKHCKKYQYQSAGMLKKIIASNIKDSSIKDDLTMVETYKKSIIYIDDNGYYYHTPIGGRGAKAQKDNTKDINVVKKRIDNDYNFLYDSSIKDFGNFKTFAEVEKYLNSKGYKIDSADKPLPGQRLKEKYITAYKNGKQKYIELFQYSNGDYEIMTSLSDSSISDKLIESGSKEALSKNIATEIKAGKDPKQAAAIAYSVQRENDASTGYKYRITNNGSKWYYETTFPDGHTTLTGPYSSKQETEQYFHKHRPTEKLTDANRYNKGQKIQTSAGIHEIIGYDPVKPDVHTNRIEYSYRLKTPNGTYTNIPDWQLEELVKLGRYKLIDSDNNKKQQLKAELDKLDKEWDRLDNLGRPTEHITAEMEAIREELKKLEDCSTVMTKDADSVKVEKIIRKEKSALGITYYIFQTKSSSGYTIYYQVTDRTYHGEPTYSGGGIISLSLKSANDTLDHNLLSDKLKAKYGEKEGTKRYLRGENDSAIHDMAETDMSMLQKATRVPAHNIYHNRISYDDLKRTINKVMEEGNDKDVVNILIGQLAELKKDYETDINNSKLDKEETKRHYNEYKRLVNNYKNSQISKEYTRAVNNFLSAIKDSNNIKNRKSYTIKVGDKQYKVFAESESEAIDKYIKSKKQ